MRIASILVFAATTSATPAAPAPAATAAPSAPAASQTPPSAHVNVDGAAIVRGAGRARAAGSRTWNDTSTGDVLTTGITVQASPDEPLEMTLPDGVTIVLEAGARAMWGTAGRLPSETNHFTHGYHLVLEEGELEVRMPAGPKGAHAFLVDTQAGTLTDWRGQLHVMVRGSSTTAAIYEGALVVGSNGQGFPVYDGAGIVMKKGVDPDKTRKIPAAPAWDDGGHRALGLVPASAASTPLDFAWTPIANAASYRFEVATDKAMVRVIARGVTTEARATAEPAVGGPYWVHVRAVGAEGIVGEWSSARPLRLLRYELPEGGFVARDGAIVLPEGGAVTLAGADGIELAYENASTFASRLAVPLYWSPAGAPLRIPEGAVARVVHLRDSSEASAATATIYLTRRQLQAAVDLGPRGAHWPADPIDARVVLRDPSGRIDATTAPVSLEAMLDLAPLQVAWQRRGDTWVGRIPPRPLTAPSVVRVRVLDDAGGEIGRGFVEIGGP